MASRNSIRILAVFLSTLPVQAQNIHTVAGGGPPGNIVATSASIAAYSPAVDVNGNVYFSSGEAVYRLDPTGHLARVAGQSIAGAFPLGANGNACPTAADIGDGGPATSALLNSPGAVAVDATGNLYIADSFSCRIRVVNMQASSITVLGVTIASGNIGTVAGSSTYGMSGDTGPATSAQLNQPNGVAVDSSGNLYIADTGNSRVRKVNTTGTITTIAGDGTQGCIGDGAAATGAELNSPVGVAADAAGNIYIADDLGCNIRVVNTQASSITVLGVTVAPMAIASVAGDNVQGYNSDGIPATSAELNLPRGVALDSSGNLYIADTGNARIREVNTSGTINTVAGDGTAGYSGDSGPATSAEISAPFGVALDGSRDLYIADENNSQGISDYRIRMVTSGGTISTVAGNGNADYSGDGQTATGAQLSFPSDVTVDAAGNLYIADSFNNVVRAVNTQSTTITLLGVTIPPGDIATVAGNESLHNCSITTNQCFGGDGGPATSAELNLPEGVALDGAGNLYIADSGNARVREVNLSGTISTVAGSNLIGDQDGPATGAALNFPVAVAVDGASTVYIADYYGNVVREVNTEPFAIETYGGASIPPGYIATVAGNGTGGYNGDGISALSAELDGPTGIAIDPNGNLYIADNTNARLRELEAVSGTIVTVAGNGTAGYSGDGGAAIGAELAGPYGVTSDLFGNLYIADYSGVRVVNTQTSAITPLGVTIAPGDIETVAGNGTLGFSGDGGLATSAMINGVQGTALDLNQNLYIADFENLRIRKVNAPQNPSAPNFTLTTTTPIMEVANGGDAATYVITITSVNGFSGTVFINAIIDPYMGYQRPATVNITPGGTQNFNFVITSKLSPSGTFPATVIGTTASELVNTLPLQLIVDKPALTPSVTVTPSPSSITTAQADTVTVTVNGGSGNPIATGSVALTSGTYASGAAILSGGSATIDIPAGSLPAGTDTLTATYTPDPSGALNYANASGSNTVTVVTTTTLVSIVINPLDNGGFGTSDGILTLGTEVPFVATGFYIDGSTQDLTSSVTWASSNTAEVMIGTNTGLAIGVGAGSTAHITASLGAVTSAATPVTVAAGTLEAVAITPATGGVDVDATMQLVAYGNYEVPGATNPWPTVLADLTHEVTWKSSNPSVASVSSAGLITGIAAGTTTITVTMPGFSGTPETASVTVEPAPPNWTLTGNLFHQTAGQSATLLNDGSVLIAGGEDSSNAVLNRAEIYSPSTGLFTSTAGNMVNVRTVATATLLPDGTVLLAGGGTSTGGGGPQNNAEIYSPTTGMFTATANNMSADRSIATATLLNTGLVLIAGGDGGGTSADLYNPATQAFTPTGPSNVARESATATLLQNGEVLIVGGRDPSSGTGGALPSAELYDPTTGAFTLLTATLAFPREFHTATLLNNGQVLIAGGTSNTESASTSPGYEELYNPATETFLPTGALNAPRIAHNALLLGDGNVLLIGGGAPNNLTGVFGQSFPPQATSEVYSPATGEFTFTGNMNFQRAEFTATLLQNGSVLAAGGQGIILFPAPAEIYTPTPDFTITTMTPTMEVSQAGNSATYMVTITPVNGFSGTIALGVCCDSALGVSLPASITIPPNGTARTFNFTITSAVQLGVGTFSETVIGSTVGGLQHSLMLNLKVDNPGLTPSVTVTPASSSITTAQSLMVTVTVNGGSGNPTPTGTVVLTSGTYTSAAATLSGGSATVNIPAGSLATGTDTLTVTYTPDTASSSIYNAATGSNTVAVTTPAKVTPTLTVTPTPTSITTTQALSVKVTVSGGSGNPTPTGAVTLTSGSYTSAAATLSSGTATINIPAGSLATGTDTLSVSYTPDSASSSTYNSATGSNTVTVTAAAVQVTVGTSPIGLSFSVDGTSYTSTQTLTWTVGASHIIATTSPQTASGTQNTFASWSDSGAISHSVTATTGTTSYTAAFTTSYQLTTAASPAADGTVTPASGSYYASGTVVDLTATANTGFAFVNWTGSVASASSASTTITMTAPEIVTANFSKAAAPLAALTPTLTFQSTTVGTTSSALSATLSNSGNATLNISSIAIGGINSSDFTVTTGANACGTTLAADASCSIYVTFTPASAMSFSATLTVTDNANPTTQSTTLTGTGTPAPAPIAALTPSLSFTSTTVGTTSSALFATLSNSGNATLNISSIAIGGTNPSDFTVTTGANACGTTLAADASCSIYVTFTPASAAGFSATLTVTDNATPITQSIMLTGTGTSPPAPIASLTPASLTFTAVSGTTSTAQTATLSNTGNATLNISGITIGGANTSDFAITTGTNACGTTLAADASCSIYVTFTPASAASFSASLQVADNASGSPQSTTLNGTGTPPPSFTISSNSGAQTIQPGGTATYTITVSAQNGTFSNAVLLSASGLPTGATGTFTPPSVTPGSASATSTLSIATGTTTASARSGPLWPLAAPALAVIGLCFLPGKQRRRWITLGLLLFASLGAFTALAACGGGFALTQPAQSYTITVTGTSGADVQTTTVQLTVQ